jgi:hypothetical protein
MRITAGFLAFRAIAEISLSDFAKAITTRQT